VIGFYDNVFTIDNITLIAQNWNDGNLFRMPFCVSIQPNQKSNLYVSDYSNHCVFRLLNIQVISSLPSVVAANKK
jgi:hypothetical protein